ncbi:MAG: hypothetical protein ACRCUE_04090 [Bosea sp. (in: a-proteobacteria)]
MNSDGKQSDEKHDVAPRLTGSFENWNFGPGAAYASQAVPLSEARFVPATVELPPGASLDDLVEQRGIGGARVLVPLVWSGLDRRARAGSSWPIVIDFGHPKARDTLNASTVNSTLATLSGRVIASGRQALPTYTLTTAVPATTVFSGQRDAEAVGPDLGLAAKLLQQPIGAGNRLVIMAVIDDGIPFAHRNLLNEAGDSTRIEYFWQQDADANGTLLFGKEFTRDDINALRAIHGPDEDAIYTAAGVLVNSADHSATLGHFASHGAHVVDAAAGWGDGSADLDFMRVIAVQLPLAMTLDPNTNGRNGVLQAALHYIFQRADDIAQLYLGKKNAPVPLVINFSYGFSGGPHDGSDKLEIAIASMVATRKAQNKPTELVMPAANTFAGRMHGQIKPGRLRTGRAFHIPWRLQPNDRTSSYLEIWLPARNTVTNYVLAFTDPLGQSLAASTSLAFKVGPGATDSGANLSINGEIIGRVEIAKHNAHWSWVRIAMAPTEPRFQALPAAAAGLWSVSLTRTGGAAPPRPVSCHIQRDSERFGYTRGGRQSYFDDLADARFTPDGAPSRIENPDHAFVRRYGTVNGLATHDQVTVVSSYFADTGRATDYGSAGPLASTTNVPGAVRFSMPADTSTALRGALAAGTRSGSAVRMSGTSMAAPLYARSLALALMAGNSARTPLVRPVTVPVTPEEERERLTRLGTVIAG